MRKIFLAEQQDGLYARQSLVKGCHVALILEVLHGTHSAKDEVGPLAQTKVHRQVVIDYYPDTRFFRINLPYRVGAQGGILSGRLPVVDSYSYDDFVKHWQGTFHDIGMAERKRVKSTGEYCYFHLFGDF